MDLCQVILPVKGGGQVRAEGMRTEFGIELWRLTILSKYRLTLAPDERSCHAACGGKRRAKPLKQRARSQVKLSLGVC